jgi:hypothetical protein
MGGSEHDFTHWNTSDVLESLEQLYFQETTFKFSIRGDKAYKEIRLVN